jgi:hypothetical protein
MEGRGGGEAQGVADPSLSYHSKKFFCNSSSTRSHHVHEKNILVQLTGAVPVLDPDVRVVELVDRHLQPERLVPGSQFYKVF